MSDGDAAELHSDGDDGGAVDPGRVKIVGSPGTSAARCDLVVGAGCERRIGGDGDVRPARARTRGWVLHNNYDRARCRSLARLVRYLSMMEASTAEPVAGLVRLNHRYHDPLLGTFISVDRLVSTTWEPYTYAGSNPRRSTRGPSTGFGLGLEPG